MAPRARRVLSEMLGRACGALLALGFGFTARLRGTRALHPVGVCGEKLLSVTPGPPSGVVVLDEPGPHTGTWTHPFWARLRDPSYGSSQQVPARAVEPTEIDHSRGVPG